MSRFVTLARGTVLAALLALSLHAPAQASANLLSNGSFEAGNFAPDGNGYESLNIGATDITDWTVISGEGAWASNASVDGLKASDGTQFLDLTGYHNFVPYSGVAQTINTTVGQQYELSFDVGDSALNGLFQGPVSVQATAGTLNSIATLGPSPSGNLWQTYTYHFTATDAATTVSLLGVQGIDYIGLDNVSVKAVPEAASVITFCLFFAMGAFALRTSRRQKTAL